MEILKKLLILVLLCLPIAELGRYIFPRIGQAPLLLNDIVVTLLVGWWIGYTLFFKKRKITSILFLPIFLWSMVMCLSLLSNSGTLALSELFTSSLYIFRWCLYACLFLIILDVDAQFKNFLLFLLMSVGQIIVLFGFVQYFWYPSLRNLYYLGWDEHLYRMFSVFFDPNFAGVFFVLVFLLTVGQINLNLVKNQRLAFVLCFFSVLDIIAIYLTYSRSALLTLIVSVAIFLVLYGKKKVLLGILILLIGAIFIAPKSLQTEGTNLFRVTSSEARLSSATTAVAIVKEHPFLGVGFNAYRYAQKEQLSAHDWMETHAGAGTDNSFLFVLATTGIVGLIFYIYLWVQIGRVIYQQRAKTADRQKWGMSVVTLASVGGVFISALFINSLFYIFIMEWLWILLGCTILSKKQLKDYI